MAHNRTVLTIAAAFLALAATPLAHAQQPAKPQQPAQPQQNLRNALFVEADQALAAARASQAELLAPTKFAHAMDAYTEADVDFSRGRGEERVRSALATAARAFKEAKDAADIASVTLASLLKTRADATNANASTFAAQQWTDAAEHFDSAARRLESGDIRGARSRADEAEA